MLLLLVSDLTLKINYANLAPFFEDLINLINSRK